MWVKGFWSEFERYGLLAVEAARELSDLESYARFCGELSWFYIAVGRYEEAIEYTLETIATVEKLDRPEEEAYCLRNLGEAYARRGNLEEARSYLQDSLRLAHEVRSESVEVRALGSLAALEMKTGNYVEAYELYERCWRKNRQILERDRRLDARMVSPIGVIVSLRGMGDAARELSRHQEARRRLQESLRWAQTEDVVEETARSQLSLAKLEALEGNSQSAKSLAQAALKTFNRLGLEQEADETEELLNVI
jgi:tetratricopeptide (TPR) repeat protein